MFKAYKIVHLKILLQICWNMLLNTFSAIDSGNVPYRKYINIKAFDFITFTVCTGINHRIGNNESILSQNKFKKKSKQFQKQLTCTPWHNNFEPEATNFYWKAANSMNIIEYIKQQTPVAMHRWANFGISDNISNLNRIYLHNQQQTNSKTDYYTMNFNWNINTKPNRIYLRLLPLVAHNWLEDGSNAIIVDWFKLSQTKQLPSMKCDRKRESEIWELMKSYHRCQMH